MRFVQFRYSSDAAADYHHELSPFCRYYSPSTVIAPCYFTLAPNEVIMVLMLDCNDLVYTFMPCCQLVSQHATQQLCLVVCNKGTEPIHVRQYSVLSDLLDRSDVVNNMVLTGIDEILDTCQDHYEEIKADNPPSPPCSTPDFVLTELDRASTTKLDRAATTDTMETNDVMSEMTRVDTKVDDVDCGCFSACHDGRSNDAETVNIIMDATQANVLGIVNASAMAGAKANDTKVEAKGDVVKGTSERVRMEVGDGPWACNF